jgi:group I intron endonuclease
MGCLKYIFRNKLLFNGVYIIINKANHKIYIGSCSSKTFLYERLLHHRDDLLNNKHCNKYLQNSFNKYGIDNFYHFILEKCDPKECIKIEQYYIDILKPEYNLQKIAGSSLGRVISAETRNKISTSNKLFWSNTENKAKMKLVYANRRKRPKKIKVKTLHKGCKRVQDLNTVKIYNSVLELHKDIKISYNYLIKVLNNGGITPRLNIKYA